MKKEINIEHYRHTLAHLLGATIVRMYPGAKLTIGPAVDNGFYYDFDLSKVTPRQGGESTVTDKSLAKIEKEMKKLLPTWDKFSHKEVSADEAREYFKGNEYKLELIEDIVKKGEKITLYTSGMFTDLCRGGHIENPAEQIVPDGFKLSHVAGAYWRGDETKPMLTRVYGLAFESKEALEKYIWQQEEAKKRDHKKLGREMKLFTLSPLVGSGLPLFQPRGMIVRKAIEDYLWGLHKEKGYSRVWTPHIAKEDLYVTSGHAAKFGDELFRVQGKEEKFFMKPMNCPHHMQIFADNQFSYRDMPVRYFEPATVYRDEKSGQLGGLTRVRSITQDDGHLFCRVSQIGDEVSTIVNIIKEFYTTMNMMDEYWVRLSTRGEDKSVYIGGDDVWEKAEGALKNAAVREKLNWKPGPGEAAFYGPKLDFMFKDAIGREWQLATIQCDFNLPERFDLSFINEKGEKERPVVIHRAISGSLERFMGVLIEHYAGDFPLWLAPVQVRVLPVRDTHNTYAQEIYEKLRAAGIRAEIMLEDIGLGKKVRAAKDDRASYFIIVGDKDVEAKKATLENRLGGPLGQLTTEEIIAKLAKEISEKK